MTPWFFVHRHSSILSHFYCNSRQWTKKSINGQKFLFVIFFSLLGHLTVRCAARLRNLWNFQLFCEKILRKCNEVSCISWTLSKLGRPETDCCYVGRIQHERSSQKHHELWDEQLRARTKPVKKCEKMSLCHLFVLRKFTRHSWIVEIRDIFHNFDEETHTNMIITSLTCGMLDGVCSKSVAYCGVTFIRSNCKNTEAGSTGKS